MNTGDIVKFKNPNADEIDKNGKFILMIVKEVNGSRVFCEAIVDLKIRPLLVCLESELIVVYKEYTEIAIPDFLQSAEWQDLSWRNDVTAHSEWIPPFTTKYELWVWVFDDDSNNREVDECKYAVAIYDDKSSEMLEYEPAEDESEAQELIKQYQNSIKILHDNHIAWENNND